MYIIIVFLPLLSFLLISLGGFYFGREGSVIIGCIGLLISFLFSLFAFYEVVLCQAPVTILLWDWLIIDSFKIQFGLLFDSLTCIMLLIITTISMFVHFYSAGYMSEDPHLTRFMSYLSLFTFFMLVLVTSDNFLQLFIGWEGVGLCSFLLINFWYGRFLANKAALKAMIVNRISDVIFILAIVLILLSFKTLDYIIVFDLVHFFIDEPIFFFGFCLNKIDLICFFLMIGCVGKSAQLGLHVWLPDAMEGPTPVSALLHAATMVTAGVFLIIRCSHFFEYSSFVLSLISLLGGLTAFFFSIVGVFQYDIKKIIAYSTSSQLGYMFFICGFSNYNLAIFHLFNHAFFKALLFLSAGSVIHALLDEQDIRRMGGLVNFLPFTYLCFFIGSFSIMGFPFMTGFYSKDLILEFTFVRYLIDSSFVYFLGVFSAFFTSVYSFRLIFFVFFGKYNGYNVHFHENDIFISGPMFILSFFSIYIGYLFSEGVIGLGSVFFNNSIFLLPSNFSNFDSEFLNPFIKNIPLLLSISGFFVVLFFYFFDFFFFTNAFNSIAPFFYYSYFFNFFYNALFIWFFRVSYIFTKVIDKGFFELVGPYGFYRFFVNLHLFFSYLKSSIIFLNISVMFISFVFIYFLFICMFIESFSNILFILFLLFSFFIY